MDVEPKKQAQKDLEANLEPEAGQLNPTVIQNLSLFFQEVDAIKAEIKEITNLLLDLEHLNEEAMSTHSIQILCRLRDRMESDMVAVLGKDKIVEERLEELDQSNVLNCRVSEACKEGSSIDRTRTLVTRGLRVKLRDMVNDFRSLREKILLDHKEDLKRSYNTETSEAPSQEVISKMISGSSPFGGEKDEVGVEILEKPDLSKCPRVTPSYRDLNTNQYLASASKRTELDRQVLNDRFICVNLNTKRSLRETTNCLVENNEKFLNEFEDEKLEDMFVATLSSAAERAEERLRQKLEDWKLGVH
ncbi:hypothetical protein CMV_006181 [Castanea mollissima]|uniref:Syntaxin n=1 Tax=Castanea mollissima TaxID=60419 RepID=A0A8J4RVT1_9ROSI|nr:hypothetical protein CMV_006181 [Castanea mollissima]